MPMVHCRSTPLSVVAALLTLCSVGTPALSHHVPGDDHTGVVLSMDGMHGVGGAKPAASGVRALYPTQSEAEAAAVHFGCEGAHQMGEQWMPCSAHNHGGHAGH